MSVAALSAVVTGCSSQGGAQQQGGGGGTSGTVGGTRYTIAMITHEQPGDTFWDRIRAGAQDAARAHNIELKYSDAQAGPEQATLVQNAIDSRVDGMAVTLAYVEQVGPAAKAAADRGIPTVAFNAGIEQYRQYGAKMYFGSDESLAGQAAGQRLTQDGARKAICVIQEQGHVALEARCAGVQKTFPNTEVVYVQGTDLAQVRSTIGAKLQEDPSITHVVTLGAPWALTALESIADTGSKAKVATFDLNVDAAKAIQDGKIMFAIDQQPYVQGYMSVASLWLNLTNGNDLGGGGPILTGPSFVDKSNIDQIVPYARNNKR
ncbi:simple sugar transport system substrate-binding protein [Pseudonocardia eucalypti]|uniref:substrate-binding domain-containing protein n=1 Tax=Pseudonocardia eucalypti TaxID=648755 RepID=UPI00181E100D|nr:simple sugar transport system substrate-binding protein [Pseudonocardia eucalypti]